MKVLLLAAGRSKRFWPLQEKTLFPICGQSLLDVQLSRLKEAGCTDITLVGGAHNMQHAAALYPDLHIVEQEDLDLGMQGALLSALPHCKEEPVMIVGGNDVVESSAYTSVINALNTTGVSGALLAQKVSRYFPGGYLEVDADKIVSIVEKPGEGAEPSDLVNIVTHAHSSALELLEKLKSVSSKKDDAYEVALDALFKKNHYVAVPYEGHWQAVKFPWHMLSLLDHLLEGVSGQNIHKSVEIHPTAVIEGDVIIEEGTKILPHATVRGPCYIGKNCIIANNSLTRLSSIGDNCVVGFCTEVKSSILHSHVWTHMTYLGESIIGNNVSFGANSITGNLRLDEQEIVSDIKGESIGTGLVKFGTAVGDDCRFGFGSGINPGIKIGAGSFIASHTLVTEDVPDRSFVRLKNGELKISDNRTTPPAPEGRDQFRKEVKETQDK